MSNKYKYIITKQSDIIPIIGRLSMLKLLTQKGKEITYEIRIIRKYEARTMKQNRLLWAYYTALGELPGYTAEEIHELMKTAFLSYSKTDKNGITNTFTKSTTELSTVEFGEYYEKVVEFGFNFYGFEWNYSIEDDLPIIPAVPF